MWRRSHSRRLPFVVALGVILGCGRETTPDKAERPAGSPPKAGQSPTAPAPDSSARRPEVSLAGRSNSAPPTPVASPECSGPERWPASMAFVHLKNAGLTDNDRLDFEKTKSVRLASEKIGDDLHRQVHRVTFTETSGATIEVITLSDASSSECSVGGVQVYLVGGRLGAEDDEF